MAHDDGIAQTSRGEWRVRWKELIVTTDNGLVARVWRDRCRTFPTKGEAVAFRAEIKTAAARGERWEDRREVPIATIRALVLGYVRAAVDGGAPIATQRFRSATLGTFLDWLQAREVGGRGARRPVSELSLGLLQDYAASLPSEGRSATTRHRKVMEVERAWSWAHERPELYPGVPTPRRLTGGGGADRLRAPAPVVAVAAPTWADVDAMRAELLIEWHRRAVLVMRYAGLRASQVCGLRWDDLDLARGILRIRAGRAGAKRGRARVVPLHPALVAELAGWGVREGLLFPRRYRAPDGEPRSGPYRGDALVEPLRRAWTAAGVSRDRWDVPEGEEGERGHGSPSHAIRRCVRSELLRAGVEEAVCLYLAGHTQGATAAAYVPEGSPEQSPWWPRMVAAVATIPDHRDAGQVVRLDSAAATSQHAKQ